MALIKLTNRVKLNFPPVTRGNGIYLLPTIQCWVSDFTSLELRDVMGFKSYGLCVHVFVWQIGLCINIKPKNYESNGD